MALNFRDYLAAISPPWLLRNWGNRYVRTALGLPLDVISQALGEAIKAPWLKSDTSPDDALAGIGSERSMPRYPDEPAALYRERLWCAWDAWLYGGSAFAVDSQLRALGLTTVSIWPAENADPRAERPAWQFESPADAANWSRFVIVINAGQFAEDFWGVGTWGDGGSWGSTASAGQVTAAKFIARKFSSGHEINPYIVVALSGEVWGPSDNPWGSGTWGGVAVKWNNQ